MFFQDGMIVHSKSSHESTTIERCDSHISILSKKWNEPVTVINTYNLVSWYLANKKNKTISISKIATNWTQLEQRTADVSDRICYQPQGSPKTAPQCPKVWAPKNRSDKLDEFSAASHFGDIIKYMHIYIVMSHIESSINIHTKYFSNITKVLDDNAISYITNLPNLTRWFI